MTKKKPYTGFHKEKPEDLTIVKEKYLNDFELIRLSNFLTENEFKIVSITNLSQKLKDYNYRDDFRIRYDMILEMTGWDKKFVRKYLDSLKKKSILVMISPGKWKFHVPTISKLLTSGTTQPDEPYHERKKITNEREELWKLYDKIVHNKGTSTDPILDGLPEGWENL
jgi:hypothetical protein